MFKMGALSAQGLYEMTEFPANWEVEKARITKEHEAGLGAQPKGTTRTPRQTRSQRNGSPV